MTSVRVTEAGRSDQTRASATVHTPEAFLNENAGMSADQNDYEPFPNRCVQLTLVGGRCRQDKKPGNDLCHLHAWKEPADAEE